jgi:hypothetical protein
VPSATTLCLNQGRFQVEVRWQDFQGHTGPARVAPASTPDSGVLSFFNPDNWEMLVKVLDGCSVNDHSWVFFAAATNVGLTIDVTDTQTGATKRYGNALGHPANAITDTTAFATCR